MSGFSSLTIQRAVTAVAALLIAFFSGFLMQHVLVEEAPVSSVGKAPDAAPAVKTLEEPKPLPVPPAATLVPILDTPPVLPDRAVPPGDSAARACDPRLFLTPAPAGTISVTFRAPCAPGAQVLLRQGPLEFAQTLDASGRRTLRLPALTQDVVIEARMGDVTLKGDIDLPQALDFQHVALIWEGPQMLGLNAFEFGAARNEMGHVWSGAPKTPVRASRGSGGFLTRFLSDTGPSVEIYTLPAAHSALSGVVRLVVEARVTGDTCGKLARARAIQPTAFRRISETDVEVALPDCDRVGEVVLLQNLLRDMRLAAH
ncbi:MAG: hypothetical protein OIF48_02005 [Silicimonas sp.]|nr:hypothetical protein [Silicimonas sp.]